MSVSSVKFFFPQLTQVFSSSSFWFKNWLQFALWGLDDKLKIYNQALSGRSPRLGLRSFVSFRFERSEARQ